ncbi:MAG: BON domain-containing protein [Nevskia sp.]|nr:BON domain-containing protein [Nevskia sp.]
MSEDLQLQQRVLEELEYDPAVNAAHIGVSVDQGVVTLSGHVEHLGEKALAAHCARRVKGVKAVAVEIHVKVPTAKKTSDDEIAARAVQILRWALHLPENDLQITVENGLITLFGEVSWGYQRRQAAECMHQLGGVVGVENRITIKPQVVPSDVRDRIRSALERSADVEVAGISIELAEDGVVVLNGMVRSLHEQIVAENAALSAPGVVGVENHLSVMS